MFVNISGQHTGSENSKLGGGANAPKGPTHIKNPKRALENGAFWGLLGPFDPVFLA